jgi:hypothetical protein
MPQGCRKGNSCHFRHDASQTASQVPSGQRSGPLKDRNRGVTVTRTPEIPRAPQGVCGFYYAQGSCRRGFDCKFSHTAGPEVTPRSQEYPIPSNPVTGGISPTTSNSPAVSLQWVQKNFRRFLQDEHYRFPSVTHMYSFARILEGVSSSYETWSMEDGQVLLSHLVGGNGIHRLNELISFTSISSRAGSQESVLSFQRGLMPVLRVGSSLPFRTNLIFFLQFCTCNIVVKSTMNHLVK